MVHIYEICTVQQAFCQDLSHMILTKDSFELTMFSSSKILRLRNLVTRGTEGLGNQQVAEAGFDPDCQAAKP